MQAQTPTTPNSLSPTYSYVAALLFLVVIGALLAAAVVGVVRHPQKFAALFEKPTQEDVLQGHLTSKAQTLFEEVFVLKDQAVGLWGAARYALFHTGSKGVLIGKNGWLFTTEEFQEYPNARQERHHKLEIITQVRDYLRAHQVELVVALVPAKARIYPHALGALKLPPDKQRLYDHFRQKLIAKDILVPDIATAFTKERHHQKLFMRSDTHWSPKGAQLAAQEVAQAVKKHCPSLVLPPIELDTHTAKREKYEGDLQKFVTTANYRRLLKLPNEMLQRTTTTVHSGGGASDALFAEEKLSVVLVGTSYSAYAQWNFDGALKSALEADVLNVADEGGGPMAPMAKYLRDTDLSTQAPAIVIWEIPERFIDKPYDDVHFDKLAPAHKGAKGQHRACTSVDEGSH
ncbi:MAG: hypothetical protein K2Q12_02720 [Rickettsiales bacterium]|nr:hypothetical protein [Rickettsiales bacterium]